MQQSDRWLITLVALANEPDELVNAFGKFPPIGSALKKPITETSQPAAFAADIGA
jgi:hypothetical protein